MPLPIEHILHIVKLLGWLFVLYCMHHHSPLYSHYHHLHFAQFVATNWCSTVSNRIQCAKGTGGKQKHLTKECFLSLSFCTIVVVVAAVWFIGLHQLRFNVCLSLLLIFFRIILMQFYDWFILMITFWISFRFNFFHLGLWFFLKWPPCTTGGVVDRYFTTIHTSHSLLFTCCLPIPMFCVYECCVVLRVYIRCDTIHFYPLISCYSHVFNTKQNEKRTHTFLLSCFNHSNLLFIYIDVNHHWIDITWNHEIRIHMSIKSTYNKIAIFSPVVIKTQEMRARAFWT